VGREETSGILQALGTTFRADSATISMRHFSKGEIRMADRKYRLKGEQTEEGRLYYFGDLFIKTDNFKKSDPNKLPVLGGACEIVMNYMVNHPELVQGKPVFEPFAGSGPMGFLALKLGARHADFLDINPRAFRFQHENAQLNGFMSSEYSIYEDDIEHYEPRQKYDALFANPPFIPTPEAIKGTLHSNSGVDGNLLSDMLLRRLDDLLKPTGEALFYAFQIEDEEGPILLHSIRRYIKHRPVELTKGYEESAEFDVLISDYIETFPEQEQPIASWADRVAEMYGKHLNLNSYVVHIGPKTSDECHCTIRIYNGEKYGEGFFSGSAHSLAKGRALENQIHFS